MADSKTNAARRFLPGKRPAVSVIIPTKNRSDALKETLRTLLDQTRMADELIVVDQSQTKSSLETGPLLLKYIYDPEITGASQARNRGMKLATGDIWLFLDDDVVLDRDFIEKLLAAYAPGVVGVSGIVTNYVTVPPLQRVWPSIFERGPFCDERREVYYRAESLNSTKPIQVSKFTGCLMSFRADAIRGLWFDENLRDGSFAEDIDFCARLPRNSILLITPRARLLHKRSPEGRNTKHWLDQHSQGANYMRQRHYELGIRNNLCFAWLNVGYALAATLSSIRRLSLEPWRAWAQGSTRGRQLGLGRQLERVRYQ
jgi:glucosyl-dolichyl phosphate glucuronosyltransferase